MAKRLKNLEFVQAHEAARSISEAAIVAYYMDARDVAGAVDHHAATMRDRLERLCEIMGLRVVDAEVVDAHQAIQAQRDADDAILCGEFAGMK